MKKVYSTLFLFLFSIVGFAANYNMSTTTRTVTCGTTDNFYDPGGSAGQYGNSQSFTLTVTAGTAGQCLTATFTTFTVESGWDYLYIYDGPSTASNLIGTYTGGASPGTVTSSSGSLTFRFTSDAFTVANGWAATIACTGTCATPSILMSTSSPTVTCGTGANFYDSGGSGGQYGNSLSYTLTMTAGTAGQCLQVTFTTFTLELNYDYLYIYDGPSTASSLIGTYTGGTSPGTITSSSGTLTFRFTSDGATVSNGWAATVSCTSSCAAPSTNINMSTGTSTLTCGTTYNFYDSGGPSAQYGDNLSYTLTLTPSNATQCLSATFTTFTLEANYDYLYIYSGTNTSGPLIGTYTGGTSPGTVTSSSGSLTFVFTSDAFTTSNGWAATVSCIAGCSGTPTAGTATASATTLACGTNTTALSVTGATSGCGITYQWQSSPNNSTWTNIAGATNATYTPTVTSATYYRRVIFCGAASANSTSVLITPSGCILISGGNYTISSCPFTGTFYDSGGSGSPYSNSESYTMTISAPAGSCVTYNFTTFSTESGYDFLKVFDGPNTSSTQIGPATGYNGASGPGSFTSSGTSITFVFTSDGLVTDVGWVANISCGSACSGAPTAGTATATTTALTCGSGTVGLGLSGNSTGCGLTYQWQSSPNNSTWTNIAGATSQTYTPTVTANTYYRCVVSCGASSANSGSVYITVVAGPANDLCANATTITMSSIPNVGANAISYTGNSTGTNACSSADQGSPTCFTNANNVWYKFVPPANGNYYVGVQTGTMSYPDVAVFSGSCGAFSTLGCAGDWAETAQPYGYFGSTYSYAGGCNMTAGTTYYVMVDSWSTDGTFTVTATALSNDQIPVAAMIANCGTSFNSTTIGATNCNNGVGDGYFTNVDNNASTTYPGNVSGADTPVGMSIENESYYQFCVTSAATFSVTVTPTASSCIGPNAGTGTTLQYILYTGSSTSLTPVCANSGFSAAYTCTISMVANQCAFILVDGWAGTNCDYSVMLQANPGCPLPIELISFTGDNVDGGRVRLDWELATEKNIKEYIIERSSDGTVFSPVMKIPSAGNSDTKGHYYAYDNNPFKGNNFYRLVPVDINGNKAVASLIMVTNKSGLPRLGVFPNPSAGNVNISLSNFSGTEIHTAIYDIYGKQVWAKNIELSEGAASKEIDLSNFDNGVYIIKAFDGTSTFTKNLVITKGN